jgi:hypothetical protein
VLRQGGSVSAQSVLTRHQVTRPSEQQMEPQRSASASTSSTARDRRLLAPRFPVIVATLEGSGGLRWRRVDRQMAHAEFGIPVIEATGSSLQLVGNHRHGRRARQQPWTVV